jgi:hypothetical protein
MFRDQHRLDSSWFTFLCPIIDSTDFCSFVPPITWMLKYYLNSMVWLCITLAVKLGQATSDGGGVGRLFFLFLSLVLPTIQQVETM